MPDGRQFLNRLWGSKVPLLHLTATTTGAETVTITRLTPTGSTLTINWGDGTANTVVADGSTAAIPHDYAGAGTWPIVVSNAKYITGIKLDNAKLGGLNTAELASNVMNYFFAASITGSTIDTAHMTSWAPTYWQLYTMPAGTYSINTAHMTSWAPTYWYLYTMPAGTYSINTAHMTSWAPTGWRLYTMPAAGSSYTFAASCMRNWKSATSIMCNDLGLLAATVNAILYDIWMGFAARTGTSGTVNVGGTNQAPSGTFQAAAACPVTAATPGKEIAHELLNDTCGVSAKHWATVTFTA